MYGVMGRSPRVTPCLVVIGIVFSILSGTPLAYRARGVFLQTGRHPNSNQLGKYYTFTTSIALGGDRHS